MTSYKKHLIKQTINKQLPTLEKMYLLDEEAFRKWQDENNMKKQLSILDKNMHRILHKKDISTTRKWVLYRNFLAQYLNFKRFVREQKQKNLNNNSLHSSIHPSTSTSYSNSSMYKTTHEQPEEETPKMNRRANSSEINSGKEEVFVIDSDDDEDVNMEQKIQSFRENPQLLQNTRLNEMMEYEDSDSQELPIDETQAMEISHIPTYSTAIFDKDEQRRSDEAYKKYDDHLIAEHSISERLNKSTQPIRSAFHNMNPTHRVKELTVDGDQFRIDLNKSKIADDGYLITNEVESNAKLTIDPNNIDKTDMFEIRSYLTEKHNQIKNYEEQDRTANNKSVYELTGLKNGNTLIKYQNQIVEVKPNVLDHVTEYLDSGYTPQNINLAQIVGLSKKYVEYDNKPTSKLPLRKNSTPSVGKRAAFISQPLDSTPFPAKNPAIEKLLTSSKKRADSNKRIRKDTPISSTPSVVEHFRSTKHAKQLESSRSGRRLDFDNNRTLDQKGAGSSKWKCLYK